MKSPIIKDTILDPSIAESITDSADTQQRLEQSQHRLQRAENRKNYLAESQRKKRSHRLITRGAAIEHIFPEIKPLTEREFFDLTEQIGELPEVSALIRKSVDHHQTADTGPAPEKEAS
ncbi:MAG: DUF3847 domain-containing protein [Clostridia bacterium]|nr:DUF3847 domain-containing protein [Clostridia bacterium]